MTQLILLNLDWKTVLYQGESKHFDDCNVNPNVKHMLSFLDLSPQLVIFGTLLCKKTKWVKNVPSKSFASLLESSFYPNSQIVRNMSNEATDSKVLWVSQ